MHRTKPILRWPGGKSRVLPHILPLIRSHTCYVEVFAGGLAVLLAKEKSKIEVVNDLNGDLVNLYRCAQWHLDALINELKWTLNSRRNLADFLAQPGLTDLQRAARFLLRNRQSFGGDGTSYGVAKLGGGGAASSRENLIKLLEAFSQRLDAVSVENTSYERILKNYDAPSTLFFMDPPYLNAKIRAYDGWDEKQMSDFAAAVQALQGDWIVTVDDSPFNRELFARHDITPVSTSNGAVNKRLLPNARFGELVIRCRQGKVLQMPVQKALKKAA